MINDTLNKTDRFTEPKEIEKLWIKVMNKSELKFRSIPFLWDTLCTNKLYDVYFVHSGYIMSAVHLGDMLRRSAGYQEQHIGGCSVHQGNIMLIWVQRGGSIVQSHRTLDFTNAFSGILSTFWINWIVEISTGQTNGLTTVMICWHCDDNYSIMSRTIMNNIQTNIFLPLACKLSFKRTEFVE